MPRPRSPRLQFARRAALVRRRQPTGALRSRRGHRRPRPPRGPRRPYAGELAGYTDEPATLPGGGPSYGDGGPAAKDAAEPEPSPAYDDAAEPEPYVAPDDPNTGAETEPFRGPFEPHPAQPKLSDLPPMGPLPAEMTSYGGLSGAGAATGGAAGPGADGAGPAGAGTDAEPDREGSREKLEKIKDLYLTVEAIGDDNVGKHFDELMQRQRELISDYFKETGIGGGKTQAAQPDPPSQN